MNQALRNVLLLEGESVNQNEDAPVADAPISAPPISTGKYTRKRTRIERRGPKPREAPREAGLILIYLYLYKYM